ncbi:Gfo/Idh/MocA family protein [Rhodoflexus caldus]|uniref:Gfo/Idh/MocA family protein n=1 Tax=Rhodoflexus caldus TaxID=2891236 RepID=UPI002029ED3A|nr:Gfo/Idh/MocA family oxidoreductase [Rhodoflexus caldus]
MRKITMLGSGFIAGFYTMSIHGLRSRDRIISVYARSQEKGEKFAREWGIPKVYTDMAAAINDPETDTIVVGLPNHLHKEAILLAAKAGKAVLCTKPLGMNAKDAKEILEAVEKAGVFHGYMEDLVYTPKTQKALQYIRAGALGTPMWARSRETHPGPHSDWFWDSSLSGGGAIIDLACHCIEITRNYIGKDIRPVEVVCWADTLMKPIEAEDNAVGMIRYENGAMAQFEVSWTFRGGLDLRDEVSGTEGSMRLDNFLRTGFEIFSATGSEGYVSEKAESDKGWLFPVGDEVHELGYNNMFTDMFNAIENGTPCQETFYDGYIVNAIMDACYKSVQTKRWEPVELEIWRGRTNVPKMSTLKDYDEYHWFVKEEVMPDGFIKIILKEKATGKIVQRLKS